MWWVLIVLVVLLAGALTALFVAFRKRGARLEALRQDEARFRSIFMQMPEAIFILDKGKVLRLNDAALALLGKSEAGSLVGQEFSDLFRLKSEADREKEGHRAGVTSTDGEHQALTAESLVDSVWVRSDGFSVPVQFRIRSLESEGQRNLCLMAKDVSHRKAQQMARQKMQDQLVQSQKMEAIGHLAGGIAQEFNNLHTAIMGNAELVLLKAQKDPIQEQMRSIIHATQRAAELTSQLLAFARKGKFRVTYVDIHELVNDLAQLIQNNFPQNISLVKELGASSTMVKGDRSQLYQALMNLALNAKEAMPDGGQLTFTTSTAVFHESDYRSAAVPQPGTYLLLKVTDTGRGIDPKVLPQIFEPFFTVDKVNRRTGMGLATVYGTVESHSGTIRVESELGCGTTFSILLPLFLFPKEERLSAAEPDRRPGQIIIIDPEELVGVFLRKLLQARGYSAVYFSGLAEALEYCRSLKEPPGLVILDLRPDQPEGNEAFDTLKTLWPEVPLVISSGHDSEDWIQEMHERGATDFLPKPFQSSDLLTLVQRVTRHPLQP